MMNVHRVTTPGPRPEGSALPPMAAAQSLDIGSLVERHRAASAAFRGAVRRVEVGMADFERLSDAETDAREALMQAPCRTAADCAAKARHFLQRLDEGECDFLDDDAARAFLRSLVSVDPQAKGGRK